MNAAEMLSEHLWFVLFLIGLAAVLTYAIFHWQKFDEGYEKGEPADPERIARDNPPDEWSKSHWADPHDTPPVSKA